MTDFKIEFIAALPPIRSAIQIDGQGDGGQIKLDVSRQYMGEILKLQVLTGKRLRVRIEEDLDGKDKKDKLGEFLDGKKENG